LTDAIVAIGRDLPQQNGLKPIAVSGGPNVLRRLVQGKEYSREREREREREILSRSI
jgi:hypothetical protein